MTTRRTQGAHLRSPALRGRLSCRGTWSREEGGRGTFTSFPLPNIVLTGTWVPKGASSHLVPGSRWALWRVLRRPRLETPLPPPRGAVSHGLSHNGNNHPAECVQVLAGHGGPRRWGWGHGVIWGLAGPVPLKEPGTVHLALRGVHQLSLVVPVLCVPVFYFHKPFVQS